MKKILLLLTILLAFNCSKDDSINEDQPQENNYWKFSYKDSCEDTTASGSFCVTKEALDKAMETAITVEGICFMVRITDLDGNTGWYRFFSSMNQCN